MKKVFLILGIALTWAGLYALGLIDLASVWAVPVFFGAAVNSTYNDGTQTITHKGGWFRFQQVDNTGSAWGTTDWMGNDTLSTYDFGYISELEFYVSGNASANIGIHGMPTGWSTNISDVGIRGVHDGYFHKYQTLGAGNGLYKLSAPLLSSLDTIRFRFAAYFQTDSPNEAGTNAAYTKIVFYSGLFLPQVNLKASGTDFRKIPFDVKPIPLESVTTNYRGGGQLWKELGVASVQAASAESWDSQTEASVA